MDGPSGRSQHLAHSRHQRKIMKRTNKQTNKTIWLHSFSFLSFLSVGIPGFGLEKERLNLGYFFPRLDWAGSLRNGPDGSSGSPLPPRIRASFSMRSGALRGVAKLEALHYTEAPFIYHFLSIFFTFFFPVYNLKGIFSSMLNFLFFIVYIF